MKGSSSFEAAFKTALPAELALAAACCTWPQSATSSHRIRALATAVTNWEHFEALVRRNRIVPLVDHAIRSAGAMLPCSVQERLHCQAQSARVRELRMARECINLQRNFDEAGIGMLIFKGVPVGLLAYGQLGMKQSWDIDLLVDPEEMMLARDLLLRLGYVSELSQAQFVRFMAVGIEAVFTHPQRQMFVELHHRLTSDRRFLAMVDTRRSTQTVSFAGERLRTLADDPLFAYLCLHGATHIWSRLKWLADVNAFVSGRSEEALERLVSMAETYSAGRSASMALRLCRTLFGLELSDRVVEKLEDSRVTRALAANVLASLAYRGGAIEHEAYTSTWVRTILAGFWREPGGGHVTEYVRSMWNSPADRATVSLPRQAHFLYHALRIPLWLHRKAKRLVMPIMRRRSDLGSIAGLAAESSKGRG